MSRLLTLMLLYQHGYIVGKYISLEKLIEENKQSYYEALQAVLIGRQGKITICRFCSICWGLS